MFLNSSAAPGGTLQSCSSSAGPTSPWPRSEIWRSGWWPWAASRSGPTAGRPGWKAAWTPARCSPLSGQNGEKNKVNLTQSRFVAWLRSLSNRKPRRMVEPTLRFRAMRMRPWLVMRRSGVLPRSWSSLSMASASIRRLCQLISLNVNTCRTNHKHKDTEGMCYCLVHLWCLEHFTYISKTIDKYPNYSFGLFKCHVFVMVSPCPSMNFELESFFHFELERNLKVFLNLKEK